MQRSLKDHLFIADDGALYDTRLPQWSKTPLRANYARTRARIDTVADFKATLRAGAYAWPGGYPMYLITSDCAALCFDCARKEARNVIDDIQRYPSRQGVGTGWRVCACDVNHEDNDLFCDHCSKQIESAYGES